VGDVVEEANGKPVVMRVRAEDLSLVNGVVLLPPLALCANGLQPFGGALLPGRGACFDAHGVLREELVQNGLVFPFVAECDVLLGDF
jgi:hypothetical protein